MIPEYSLLREMMQQGEFQILTESDQGFVVNWWCRRTYNHYEYISTSLWESLHVVLKQAHEDPEPAITDAEVAASEKITKKKIYIPQIPPLPL